MPSSIYQTLRPVPPVPDSLQVNNNYSELLFELVSCMCDNISYIRFKEIDGQVKISHFNNHCSLALSNLQLACTRVDLEWAFEDISRLIRLISTGTSRIKSVTGRYND